MQRILLTVVLLLFSFELYAAGVPEGTRVAAAPRQYDEKTALTYSQAVLGNPVGNHLFRDTLGRTVRLSEYRGKPLIISLIYTSCYHICPTTTRFLSKVVDKARDALGGDSFNVITVGFDHFNDNPEAMRAYARKQGVDTDNWKFLSADKATIEALSAEVGFLYYPSSAGFDHLIQATLVGADGNVYRQVYGMEFETPLLIEPLKELVFGQPTSSVLHDLSNQVRLFCTVYDPRSDKYRFDYSLFLGMLIGASSLILVLIFLVNEWRRRSR